MYDDVWSFLFDDASTEEILDRYMTGLKNSLEFSRMGAAMALGVLPRFFLMGKVDKVSQSLTLCLCSAFYTCSRKHVCVL